MIETLKAFQRSVVFRFMKNLIFTVLVFLLCRKWYIFRFGNFTYTTDWNEIAIYFSNEQEKWVFAFFIFCGVYMGAFVLEVRVIPIVAALFFGKFDIGRYSHNNLYDNPIQKKLFGSNPLISIFRTKPRLEIYQIYSFVPVCFILAAIYFNTLLGYALLFIFLYITIVFYRFLNSLYEEYNRIP